MRTELAPYKLNEKGGAEPRVSLIETLWMTPENDEPLAISGAGLAESVIL